MSKATVSHIDSHPKRGAHAIIPAAALHVMNTIGLPQIGEAYGYSLRRRKFGAEIFLHYGGGFSLNLNIAMKHTPANFKEARQYAKEIAERFGVNLVEVDRRRGRPKA